MTAQRESTVQSPPELTPRLANINDGIIDALMKNQGLLHDIKGEGVGKPRNARGRNPKQLDLALNALVKYMLEADEEACLYLYSCVQEFLGRSRHSEKYVYGLSGILYDKVIALRDTHQTEIEPAPVLVEVTTSTATQLDLVFDKSQT